MKNKKEICNLQKIFQISIFLKLPIKLIRILIKLPFTKFYELIFEIIFMISLSDIYNLSILTH